MSQPRSVLTFGSLFAGIGCIDAGLVRAGMTPLWQCEMNRDCRRVLRRTHNVKTYHDVRTLMQITPARVDVLAGGDPCPSRSRARGYRETVHPDLAGYFLALAGRLAPEWVVRENVPAPDVAHFAAAMELLGYRVVAIELDGRDFTGQSRRRQWCIGCPPDRAAGFARAVSDSADDYGFGASRPEETTPFAACLTAHPNRLAAEDTYCFEPGRGLRVLDSDECESLMGLPRGTTSGFSRSRRREMLGNGAVVGQPEFIGRCILDSIQEAA